jgi:hypothetical protein
MPQRVVHVDRTALEQNNRTGVWSKPTLIVGLVDASKPVNSIRAHAVEVTGVTTFAERPPGVHAFVDDAALIVPFGPEGKVLELPAWAQPTKEPWARDLPDVVLAASKRIREVISSLTRQRDAFIVLAPKVPNAERVLRLVQSFDLAINELSRQRQLLAVAAGGSIEDTKPGTGEYRVVVDDEG